MGNNHGISTGSKKKSNRLVQTPIHIIYSFAHGQPPTPKDRTTEGATMRDSFVTNNCMCLSTVLSFALHQFTKLHLLAYQIFSVIHKCINNA